jgi:hypothetical protein
MRNPKLLPPLMPNQIWSSPLAHDCQPTHITNLGEKKEKGKKQAIDGTSTLSLSFSLIIFIFIFFLFAGIPVICMDGHILSNER